jgi:hypothetical protein
MNQSWIGVKVVSRDSGVLRQGKRTPCRTMLGSELSRGNRGVTAKEQGKVSDGK